MRFFLDAMNLIGVGSIPLILFVLGGTLSNGPTAGSSDTLPNKCMVTCLIAKLLLVPAANLMLIRMALQAGMLPHSDELLPLTLTVVGASPTAMQLSTISSLVGAGQREVANLLFWQVFNCIQQL